MRVSGRISCATLNSGLANARNLAMNIFRPPAPGAGTGEAEVVVWLKAVGESITVGEPVLEVQSDKANVEVEATTSGTLAHVLVEEGQNPQRGGSAGSDRGARGAARRCGHQARAWSTLTAKAWQSSRYFRWR